MADVTIISPTPGSVLDGSFQTFRWRYDGVTPESSWIYAGSEKGGWQYAVQWTGVGNSTSIGGLANGDATVYIRLWYRVNGLWRFIDETYEAAPAPALPFFTAPSFGGTLAGSTQVFRWDFNSVDPELAWLYVGTRAGGSEFAAVRTDDEPSVTVTGLPTDGRPVHARLYFMIAGTWHYIDEMFSSALAPQLTRDELARQLQGIVGVTVDGDIGPRSKAALNANWLGRAERFDASFAERLVNDEALVSWTQERIAAQGGPAITADGDFGSATDAAVRSHLGRGGVVAAESFIRLLDDQLS